MHCGRPKCPALQTFPALLKSTESHDVKADIFLLLIEEMSSQAEMRIHGRVCLCVWGCSLVPNIPTCLVVDVMSMNPFMYICI